MVSVKEYRNIGIIIVVLFSVVLGGSYLYDRVQPQSEISNPTGDQTNDLRIKILLSTSGEEVTYRDFLNDLEKVCPYYVPSGVAYRDCLANLLIKKENAVGDMYDEILAAKKKDLADPKWDAFVAVNQNFITNIIKLHSIWKPYRDALCDAQLSSAYGGSNESGMINTCKIYQTDLYANRLANLQ